MSEERKDSTPIDLRKKYPDPYDPEREVDLQSILSSELNTLTGIDYVRSRDLDLVGVEYEMYFKFAFRSNKCVVKFSFPHERAQSFLYIYRDGTTQLCCSLCVDYLKYHEYLLCSEIYIILGVPKPKTKVILWEMCPRPNCNLPVLSEYFERQNHNFVFHEDADVEGYTIPYERGYGGRELDVKNDDDLLWYCRAFILESYDKERKRIFTTEFLPDECKSIPSHTIPSSVHHFLPWDINSILLSQNGVSPIFLGILNRYENLRTAYLKYQKSPIKFPMSAASLKVFEELKYIIQRVFRYNIFIVNVGSQVVYYFLYKKKGIITHLFSVQSKYLSNTYIPSKSAIDDLLNTDPLRNCASGICFNPSRGVGEIVNGQLNLSDRILAYRKWGECRKKPPSNRAKEGAAFIFDFWKDNICNGQIGEFEYFKKWFVHLIQKPMKKTLVCIILYSEREGTGKGTLVDLLFGRKIIGASLYSQVNSIGDLFNKFNNQRIGRLLLNCDEVNNSLSKEGFTNTLKGYITEPFSTYEQKYLDSQRIANFCNFLITTNVLNCIPIKEGDRRYYAIETSDENIGNIPYWNLLNEYIEDDEVVQEFYYQLMDVDISNFVSTQIIKPTKLYASMLQLHLSPIKAFLQELSEGSANILNGSNIRLYDGDGKNLMGFKCQYFVPSTDICHYLQERRVPGISYLLISTEMEKVLGNSQLHCRLEMTMKNFATGEERKMKVSGYGLVMGWRNKLKGANVFLLTDNEMTSEVVSTQHDTLRDEYFSDEDVA